jgi:hypothetical protein
MAPAARDFYKNGPSFLNRYLPIWMVAHVQRLLAVLLAAGVIVYPLFNFAPKLYQRVHHRLGSSILIIRAVGCMA